MILIVLSYDLSVSVAIIPAHKVQSLHVGEATIFSSVVPFSWSLI